MMATYSQLTEKPIGFPEEEDVIPSQGLRIEFNVISPPSGTSIGIRGVGVTALAQLFSQYCQSLCSNQEYSLQSQALVETCTRHRQYQYHERDSFIIASGRLMSIECK